MYSWTSTVPSAPGRYWFKLSEESKPMIVEISMEIDQFGEHYIAIKDDGTLSSRVQLLYAPYTENYFWSDKPINQPR